MRPWRQRPAATATIILVAVGVLLAAAPSPVAGQGQVGPGGRPPQRLELRGTLERIERRADGRVRVAGWAGAPQRREPVTVTVSVNGRRVAVTRADIPRPDVRRQVPTLPPATGFDLTLPAAAWTLGRAAAGTALTGEVCLEASHPGGGGRRIGCAAIPGGRTDQGVVVPDGERVQWLEPPVRARSGAAAYHPATDDAWCRAPNGPLERPMPDRADRCLAWYRPGPGVHPTLVWLHGGGWSGGSADPPPAPVLRLVDRGWTVVTVRYRLSTCVAHQFPAAVLDTQDAIAYLRGHPERFGVDPARIVVAGHSAGGNLAAMAATVWNDPAARFRHGTLYRPAAWVSVAGVEDLEAFLATSVWPHALWPYLPYRPFPPPGCRSVPPGWVPESWALEAASPVRHLDPADPPGLVVRGGDDLLTPVAGVSARIGRVYTAAGRPDGFWQQVVPGDGHFPRWNRRWWWWFLDRVAADPTRDPSPPPAG